MGVRARFGPTAPAVPGEVARYELTVDNDGPGSESLRVELVGEVAAWAWATPSALTLGPGETAVVGVTVRLPRAPHPPAGPLPLTVAVAPAEDLAGTATASTTVDVAPFVAAVAFLRPHTSTGRTGHHTLTVENRGNASLAATVTGEGEGVAVDVRPAQVEAGPGASAEAEVVVRAGRGRAGARRFELLIRPDGHGDGELARAEGTIEVPTGGWAGRVAAAVVVLALVGVALRATVGGGGGSAAGRSNGTATTAAPAATASAAVDLGPASDCPGRDHLSPDANGIVRPGIKPLFDYSFLFVSADGCQPARFNPCEPLRYILNRTQATDPDVADLDEAIRKVSDATGLRFEYAGTSSEDPRSPARPVRAADGTLTWPPVLIGWAHLGTGDSLRPSTTGPAGAPSSQGVVGGGGRPLVTDNVITTGNLVLNLDAVTDTDTHNPVPHGFGSGVNWGRIMMHELAHVIGLGHVESRTSIMNETLTQQTIPSTDFGLGDLRGLRYLGREGGCLVVPALQTTGTPRP